MQREVLMIMVVEGQRRGKEVEFWSSPHVLSLSFYKFLTKKLKLFHCMPHRRLGGEEI
jgi:hypothetical protein